MDPLPSIKIKKDSSFAMMLAARKAGWQIHTIYQSDLYVKDNIAWAHSRTTHVEDNAEHWFEFSSEQEIDLGSLDVILMRKDPPFDIEYITSTYILEMAEKTGTLVVNKPASLRNYNEKMFESLKEREKITIEIGVTPQVLPIHICLFDSTELFFGTQTQFNHKFNHLSRQHLWTNSQDLIALVEYYYELTWQKSKKFKITSGKIQEKIL